MPGEWGWGGTRWKAFSSMGGRKSKKISSVIMIAKMIREGGTMFRYLSEFMKSALGTKREQNNDKANKRNHPCRCIL